MEKMTGKVWVLGDDIDTDIIIPTEYLALKTIDDMIQSAPPGACRTDQAGRYHCCRKELRLRLFQGTGPGDHQSAGNPMRDREILREDLLP